MKRGQWTREWTPGGREEERKTQDEMERLYYSGQQGKELGLWNGGEQN